MNIIIGGSGSSGSTMLINKLSTHPEIFSGSEINFFNKEQLFENWDENKLKILPYLPYFSTKGWQIYRRNYLHNPDYGWTKTEIKKLLKDSPSINTFTETYFKRGLNKKGAKIWIEKTPSNCYSFTHFLKTFPKGKVIHIVRNPLDSAASMYRKDPRVFYAVGTWLYNNAAALEVADSDRYYLVKYEDLITDTEDAFNKLCNFIGVDSAKLVLETMDSEKHIDSWNNSPRGAISTSSMGAFNTLEEQIKNEIYTAFSCFKISDTHSLKKQIKYTDYESISQKLNYSQELFPVKSKIKNLKKDLRKDKLVRTLKGYFSGGDYYPVDI